MAPQGDEREAREEIDRLLTAAGWLVFDADKVNLTAGRGVAIREFPLKQGFGESDYLLYVDGKAARVIEAKRMGATLSGVEVQSARYTKGLPDALPAWERPLPFGYESTGIETRFTKALDPKPRSRPVFAFNRPETLAEWLEPTPECKLGDAEGKYAVPGRNFLARMQHLPPLADDLWPPKPKAIEKVPELRD